MRYMAAVETDIGISKSVNQDSALLKHASYGSGEVLMAVVCDGMGGLSKGELASAAVIRRFGEWFDTELAYALEAVDVRAIGRLWTNLLREENDRLISYEKRTGTTLGTTFSGILFADDQYLIAHVGDSRVYRLGTELTQLTTDQTFVAREVANGTMTPEEARTDYRRNMLLQCLGATGGVDPEIVTGQAEEGIYLLCSDGFRHEISEEEIYDSLQFSRLPDRMAMHTQMKELIGRVKERKEQDNITAITIRADRSM